MMEFHQIIKPSRKEQNLSMEKVSELIGIEPSYLGTLENNRHGYTPTLKRIKKFSEVLNLDFNLLLEAAKRVAPFSMPANRLYSEEDKEYTLKFFAIIRDKDLSVKDIYSIFMEGITATQHE